MIRVDDHGRDLAKAIAYAGFGGEVVLGAGTYDVAGGTRFAHRHNLTVRGEGHATRVRIVGHGDVTFGDAKVGEMRNLRLRDFALVTSTQRAGWSLRLDSCVRTLVSGVAVDPVDVGWRNERGIWVNLFDDVTLDNIEVNCRHVGVMMNGRADQGYGGDLYLTGGSKITNMRTPAEWVPGSVGVHVAGAAGGVFLEAADVIHCGVGLLVDQAVARVPNREIFLGSGLYLDSCAEDCARLGPQACSTFSAVGAWLATAGLRSGGYPNGNGLNVHHEQMPLLVGKLTGCTVFNCRGTGVALSGGDWIVSGSAVHENGGYGVHRANSKARVLVDGSLLRANARGHHAGGVTLGNVLAV